MKIFLYILTFIITLATYGSDKIDKDPNIYIISIGINSYPKPFLSLRLCVNDAIDLVNKLKQDNLESNENKLKFSELISYTLIEEKADLDTIRQAFKDVISQASTNDYFIFLYSGYSIESKNGKTFLVPYMTDADFELQKKGQGFEVLDFDENKMFSLVELAKFMEQISCKNQLVISEAGNGTSFGHNLISELFESNPIIAEGTERNRIIITTKEMGREGGSCGDVTLKNGYLMSYILQNENILNVFSDLNAYEFWLTRSEMMCPPLARKYIALFNEKDYQSILLKNYKEQNSRGSVGNNIKNESENKTSLNSGKTYALLIATNNYLDESWKNLKNPINDAEALSEVLKYKYGVEVKTLYDSNSEQALKEISDFKNNLRTNDRFILFVAGHGYYDSTLSDGFLAFSDSKAVNEDYRKVSFLQMATLNRMLDGLTCKQVFAMFDVCFGSSFDLNSPDLALSNYKSQIDIPLDEFIKRKDEYISRIFLASGKAEVPDYWSNSLDHSPFANKLIQALKDEKEFISPGKLYSISQANATEPYLKRFGKHEERGDFLLKVLNKN